MSDVNYIVYQRYLRPSNVKGELPDVVYEYISITSMIGWHYDFTRDIEEACWFEEEEATEIAGLWGMSVKRLDNGC